MKYKNIVSVFVAIIITTVAVAATNKVIKAVGTADIEFVAGGSTRMTVDDSGNVNIPSVTASRAVITDGSSNLNESSVTSTELGYVSGVTSAIQTQIDGKEGTLTNSAGLAAALSDETGTNLSVFSTSPVLRTPQIDDTSNDHQYIFAVSELTLDRTVTMPLLTGNDEFVFKDHAVTMTNKTLTSPVLNTGVSGTAILDEDNMASDSATQLATQQSIKAYVDANGVSFPILADDGTVAAPSYSFTNSTNTGLYYTATDVLNFAAGGVQHLVMDGSDGQTLVGVAGAGVPNMAFIGDEDTGIDWKGTNTLAFYAGAGRNVEISSSAITFFKTLEHKVDGNAGAPAIRVANASGVTTGLYNYDTTNDDALSISCDGTECARFDGGDDKITFMYETEFQGAVTSPVEAMGALDVDWSASNIFTKSIAANSTITFSNQTAGQAITLIITADSTERTLTWTPTLKWSGGTAQVTVHASATLVCSFIYDGTNNWASCIEDMQ